MVLDSIYRINLSNARSFIPTNTNPVAMQDTHELIEADEGKQ